ncbi:MAG: N-6 DNA methylase [Ignavibacteriales bacterium]|nr:N-6 DNA methylase [Ignavibacteriales bacterium]
MEGLIPPSEKKKFGQYFTNPILADLVAFPAISTNNDLVFDPTCGTGTFLESFYHIFRYLGVTDHSKLLHQIWGNDISHFPSTLSVINLYKQDIRGIENFPGYYEEIYLICSLDLQFLSLTQLTRIPSRMK